MLSAQIFSLCFTLLSALAAIYFQANPPSPYTYLAAAATFAGTVISICQAIAAKTRSEFIQQTLSHLARSIPPSIEWKNEVIQRIQKIAKADGYSNPYVFSDQSNFDDPEARWLLWFKSDTGPSVVCGLAVIFPQDFSNLSILSGKALDKGIRKSFFDSWEARKLDYYEASAHMAHTVEAVYGLAHFRQGFKVAESFDPKSGSLQVNVGEVELKLDRHEFERLSAMACSAASFELAKKLGQADSEVANFLAKRIEVRS